ncbi:hypothetical protein Ciccas_002732 [Cichlidogyrus casuarinus]|uniref:Uncharacterized protein n=1 Tax=Cichlidogyrus casuarinus TaxID=1844966 RepID=A0ABD2QGE6_9PLAT
MTFGAGGHSSLLVHSPTIQYYALDRDPSVIPFMTSFRKLKQLKCSRFMIGSFSAMPKLVDLSLLENQLDAVLMDLGVSSMQLDRKERGFAYSSDSALDMRMCQEQK